MSIANFLLPDSRLELGVGVFSHGLLPVRHEVQGLLLVLEELSFHARVWLHFGQVVGFCHGVENAQNFSTDFLNSPIEYRVSGSRILFWLRRCRVEGRSPRGL